MSNIPEYITAIDIGTTKIVAIAGRKNKKGRLEIIGIGQAESKGVKRGIVLNIEETAGAIQQAVAQAEDKSGIKFQNVFVGIAGQHVKSIRNRGYRYIDNPYSEIRQEDLDELTRDMYKVPVEAGEEIIHVIPQNYIVDNEAGVKNPVGMAGKRLEANFHIVIGQIASARNINTCINRTGLKVVKLILEPLASSEAVLTDDEKEAGVALIDIGGGTTDLALYYDNIIRHTAVIPFGGNVVTSDIKEGCSILNRYAEQLKVQYGSALSELAPEDKVVTIPGIAGRDPKEISFKTLSHIIQARMEEIIDAFAYEIEMTGFHDKIGAGICLTGGGALMKHLPQLVKFKTGYDVRIGFPAKHSSSQEINKNINLPMYSTSVGLLLKGFEFYESKKSDIIAKHEEEEIDVEVEKVESKTKKERLFGSIKNVFTDIFEIKDGKM